MRRSLGALCCALQLSLAVRSTPVFLFHFLVAKVTLLVTIALFFIMDIAMTRTHFDSKETHTVTRADLAEAVYGRVGLSRSDSAEMVEIVLGEISEAIARGEVVKLSSFGSFMVRMKGERVGRNPKTGIEVPITPRKVMVFKPSNIMKQRINEGTAVDVLK